MNLGGSSSALLCAILLAGCAAEDPAMGAAEALLADVGETDGSSARAVETLESAASGLPGGARALGIVDDDGDGNDDDGRVSVTVDGEWACVTLPSGGKDGDVAGGACS